MSVCVRLFRSVEHARLYVFAVQRCDAVVWFRFRLHAQHTGVVCPGVLAVALPQSPSAVALLEPGA